MKVKKECICKFTKESWRIRNGDCPVNHSRVVDENVVNIVNITPPQPIPDWNLELLKILGKNHKLQTLEVYVIFDEVKQFISSLLLSKEEKVKEEILDEVIDLVKIFPTGMFDSTPYLKELLKRLDTLKR